MTWLANALASSAIYFSAGLFWNLDWKPYPGMFFAFTQAGWPLPSSARFVNVLWPAIIFMVLISLMIVPLVWLGQ